MKGDGAMNEKSMKKLKEYAKESKDLYLQYSVSEKNIPESIKKQNKENMKLMQDALATLGVRWRDLASDAHIKFCRS